MGSPVTGARLPSGRPTSTEAARLTERLRQAAVELFLERGYDGTTMEAVAGAAGITKSTLYSRHPDKRSLFVAVSSWALTRQERDERVLEPLPDDLGAALTAIARTILVRCVDPDVVRMSRMAVAESARFPEFAKSTQAATWTPRIQTIMDLLRRHERAGTVVVRDVELAAEQFFAMVGAMPAWLAAYGVHRTPEAEEQHLEHAVELFLNGVLVRKNPRPDQDGHGRVHTEPVAERHRQPTSRSIDQRRLDGHLDRRQLGRSALLVTHLALGTTRFGTPECDERTAVELVERYLDAGGNLVDTTGASEEICGRTLRGRRTRVALAAQVTPLTGERAQGAGNGRRHIREACEASLRRLQTDYIDLYQLHVDALATPLEETMDALDDLVRAGKVLYVGASNLHAYRLMKALAISDRRNRTRFVSFRGRYDLITRTLEREHLPLLQEEGLGLISRSPLNAGASPPEAFPAVRNAASQLGCTAAQLALAWQRTKPVTATIVDAGSVAQLEEALATSTITIPAQLAEHLDQAAGRPR